MPLQVGDPIVWTRPDHTIVYCRVTGVEPGDIRLRCHRRGDSWTRHQSHLFPSQVRRAWTPAELLETQC